MRVKNWRSALVAMMAAVLISPLFLTVPTGQAYGAPDTLDLQLDDPAVIRWDVTGIMPGDSGIEPVNLHNAGDIPGYIYIWISDIADAEGLNPESETGDTSEPGELSAYIYLDIVNTGMNFGKLTGTGSMEPFDLPVNVAAFPGSSDQALFILDTAINPGETLELQWQWQLPSSVGNEVQGDTVSFSIYYMLSSLYAGEEDDEEEIEPAGPPVYIPPPTVPPITPTTTTPVTTTPMVERSVPARIYYSEDCLCVIYIPEGLHVFIDSGEELTNIIISSSTYTPSAPELYRYAGRIYRILSYGEDGWRDSSRLQQEVKLTVYFDPDEIPEGADVFLVSYHPVYGWIGLDATGDLSIGQFTAWVDYLSLVAVMYEVDVSYIELIAPDIATQATHEEESSENRAALARASLGVAISGTVAMAILAIIERKRRCK